MPFRTGTHNLDEVRIEYFGDETTAFEAFRVGEITATREFNVARWDSQYDFPAVASGDVILEELAHQRPSGMTGFVMNTRRAPFDDWRVREALITAFNFEFINDAMTGGAQPRITSYFSNSPLGMRPGPAEGRVLDYLMMFEGDLPDGAIEGYALPVSSGQETDRASLSRALDLFAEAGWTPNDTGQLVDDSGTPLESRF